MGVEPTTTSACATVAVDLNETAYRLVKLFARPMASTARCFGLALICTANRERAGDGLAITRCVDLTRANISPSSIRSFDFSFLFAFEKEEKISRCE